MLHQRTRPAAVAAAMLLAASCSSSSPTAPDPASNRMELLPPGAYMLLMSTAPEHVAACHADPPRPPALIGLVAIAALTIAHDGQTWVARATSGGDGDVELRLRHVRDETVINGQVYTATVEGTIRGSMLLPGGVSFGDRVSFGPSTETRVQGAVTRSATGLGTMTGEIVQSNSATTVSCPTVRWTLSRGVFPGF
jgi:hypothetical protein